MTDEANQYVKIGRVFAKQDSVDHSREEYTFNDDRTGTVFSTNNVEGYYPIFKRGMKGSYQHHAE